MDNIWYPEFHYTNIDYNYFTYYFILMIGNELKLKVNKVFLQEVFNTALKNVQDIGINKTYLRSSNATTSSSASSVIATNTNEISTPATTLSALTP
jgi:hypothetical protein